MTIPFSYALFVNVCEERLEQFGTVHVKVKDMRGSRGSVWRRCVCDPENWDVDEAGGAESDDSAEGDSFEIIPLGVALEPRLLADACVCGPLEAAL